MRRMVKAVQTGDQDGVKHLVFAGADLDWHDEKGKDVYTYMYMHMCLCIYTCNMQMRDEDSRIGMMIREIYMYGVALVSKID